MNFTTWGPNATAPLLIKRLILWTCIISISSILLQSILEEFGIYPGPQNILSLSWWGLNNGFLWQPLSFLLIQESINGLSFFYLLNLFFNMYLLWITAGSIIELIGKASFLRLYFLGGIVAGLIAVAFMPLSGQYKEIAGSTPSIIIILTLWVMAFPETQIFLFFLIPIKAKWVVAGIIGAILLINLAHWEFTNFILYVASIGIGYGYAAIIHGWHSPYDSSQYVDLTLASLGLRLRRSFPHWKFLNKQNDKNKEGKIIDLKTGKPLSDDEAFVDAMLAKISKYGESSLTWTEKRRLQQISERKMQDKH